MPRLAAIRRLDIPSAPSRRTSRIFRIGNLSWGISPSLPLLKREQGHADSRITQQGSCTRPRYSHPGRHGPESVDVINRNGGWTSCAGIGGRHQPVRAVAAEIDESRLVGVERELVPSETLAQNIQNPLGILEVRERHHGSSSGEESHLSALTGRVGDWRAGLGRSLYSLLPRPFGCEVSQHLDRATFPVPATSNAACGFPSLRSPACFASRVMGPILLGRLSAAATEPCSR